MTLLEPKQWFYVLLLALASVRRNQRKTLTASAPWDNEWFWTIDIHTRSSPANAKEGPGAVRCISNWVFFKAASRRQRAVRGTRADGQRPQALDCSSTRLGSGLKRYCALCPYCVYA